MKAAGLTQGGFYKHFADKNQLLHEAIATALANLSEHISALTHGKPRIAALRQVIGLYLSEDHMRRPDLGCALAAMGTEIARMPTATKYEVSKALEAYADQLSYLMPGKNKEEQRNAFLILFPFHGRLHHDGPLADQQGRTEEAAGNGSSLLYAFILRKNAASL